MYLFFGLPGLQLHFYQSTKEQLCEHWTLDTRHTWESREATETSDNEIT